MRPGFRSHELRALLVDVDTGSHLDQVTRVLLVAWEVSHLADAAAANQRDLELSHLALPREDLKTSQERRDASHTVTARALMSQHRGGAPAGSLEEHRGALL